MIPVWCVLPEAIPQVTGSVASRSAWRSTGSTAYACHTAGGGARRAQPARSTPAALASSEPSESHVHVHVHVLVKKQIDTYEQHMNNLLRVLWR